MWGYAGGEGTPATANKRAVLDGSVSENNFGWSPVEYSNGLAYLKGWYMLVLSHSRVAQANWMVIMA